MSDAGDISPAELAEVKRRLKAKDWLEFATSWARPAACWVAVTAIAVNTIVLPLAQLWGVKATPIEAAALFVLIGPIVAYVIARSVDKAMGTTTEAGA